MGADERRFEVLRAIVADYVHTHEPIGSKALVERYSLGVSSATVRNDMASLEDDGYLTQPHTSAGRIPTDKGYRLFVDQLADLKPLSPAERKAIHTFLDGAIDLDDVLRRSVRLLAQLTRQVAVIQVPSLSRATVRHIEVVSLTTTRLMLVLITDTGRVDQRMVDLRAEADPALVAQLRELLNNALVGERLPNAANKISDIILQAPEEMRSVVVAACTVLVESLIEHPEERLVLGGTANLTRNVGDFPGSLRTVLEALEEQVVVLKLLTSVSEDTVMVRIGHENEDVQMQNTSVVSIGYGQPGSLLGGMGVVGPTRMDYPGTIASVRAVADYVGKILSAQ
jgi:heat-inducible transcriptional repressor